MKTNLLLYIIAAAVTVTLGGAAHSDTFIFTQNTPFVFSGNTVSSILAVSGVTGNVTDVNVSFPGMKVNTPNEGIEEFDILLLGPQGQKIILMSFVCDATKGPIDLTFDDDAASNLTAGDTQPVCVSGSYLPSDYSAIVNGYILDAPPAPAPPYSTDLKDFNGVDPNGNWTLYAEEGGGDQNGTIPSWSITIETDAETCSDPPAITTSILANGSEGIPYNQTLQASDGTPPYTWSVSIGSLPSGLSLNSATGAITGTPSAGSAGTSNFTVTVTDTVAGCSDNQALSITIGLPGECAYEELFDDGALTYLELNQDVQETGGNLVLTPTNKRAYSVSDSSFAGIQNGTITSEIMFGSGGAERTKAWIFSNWTDKKHTIEVVINAARGRVIIKQKDGSLVARAKGNFAFALDTVYTITTNYDGTSYVVAVDGTPVATLAPDGTIPSGILGFASRGFVTSVNRVCVTP